MAVAREDGPQRSRRRVVELPATRQAPALARRTMRSTLAEWGCDDVDDVVLATSELVTNAVSHTASASRLEISSSGPILRIEVHDGASSIPVVRESGAAGGYGLHIVDSVSDAWGWEHTTTGKLVWATFTLLGGR